MRKTVVSLAVGAAVEAVQSEVCTLLEKQEIKSGAQYGLAKALHDALGLKKLGKKLGF